MSNMNNMSNMKKALLLCFVAAITACTPESEFGPLDGEAGRCLMLDEVKWDSEGWPYIDVPSRKLKKGPVFKKLKTDNDNE